MFLKFKRRYFNEILIKEFTTSQCLGTCTIQCNMIYYYKFQKHSNEFSFKIQNTAQDNKLSSTRLCTITKCTRYDR